MGFMKKILLSLAIAAAVVPAMATDYTDNLQVAINGAPTPAQTTTITVNKRSDGAYDFNLKNFSFQTIRIGDLALDSVPAVSQDGVVYLADTKTVHVNLYGVLPLDLPVTLRAELRNNESKLYASMDIPVTALHQDVTVIFGNGYQIPNSDFDKYQTYNITTAAGPTAVQEALSWHSFASASGSLKNFANSLSAPHTFRSTVRRNGVAATDSASLMLTSTSIFGIIANGTATTGRMNCGAAIAADTQNHAALEINDSLDAHGDPYYVALNGQPDSIAVWYAFKQGTPNAAHPYATINAVVTDGTYYQDPEDKAYTNKHAQAQDNKIATTYTTGAPVWKRLVVPFSLINSDLKGKAILVTISTNADPGQGSLDTLYVDDLSLIYNTPKNVKVNFPESLTNGTLNPDDITVTYDSTLEARVVKDIKQVGDSVVATVTVYSGDLTAQAAQFSHSYAVTSTGINKVNADALTNRPTEIYDITGRRVNAMTRGGLYIIKTADGKTVKKFNL